MVYSPSKAIENRIFEARLVKIVTDHGELYARRIAEFVYPFTEIHCCTMEYSRVETALRRLVKNGKLYSELRNDISLEKGTHVRRRWYRTTP